MAIDWNTIRTNPRGFADGLGGLADAFMDLRRRQLQDQQMRMQAAQHAADLQQQQANQQALREFERQRLGSEEERARARLAFDAQKEERERAERGEERVQKAIPEVTKALRGGFYNEAELLAGGAGIAMKPEARPQDPGRYTPQQPPQRPQGAVNIDAPPEDVERQIQAREQYNRDDTEWAVNEMDAEEQHAEQQRAFQEGQKQPPSYMLNYNGRPLAVYRGGEAQRVSEGEAQRAAGAFGEASQSDLEKQADAMIAAGLKSGTIKPENATAERAKWIDNAERRRIAEIAANKPRGGDGWRREQGEARVDVAEWTAAKGVAQTVFQNLGFKETAARNRKFNDMSAAIANPNAALDAMSAGTFVKEAQGGTGVISDADMEAFWNRIGGVTTRTAQWVANVMDGKIEAGKRAIVSEAVRWLASRAQQNLVNVRSTLEEQYKTAPPSVAKYGPGIVRSYFDAQDEKKKPGAAGGKDVDSWLDSL